MDKKHKGCLAEILVCAELIKNGYEVFRNISAHGPADIIAWDPDTNEIRKIDVKTVVSYQKIDGTISFNYNKPTDPSVELVLVHGTIVLNCPEKVRRGRPTTEEVQGGLKEAVDAERALQDDLERIRAIQ